MTLCKLDDDLGARTHHDHSGHLRDLKIPASNSRLSAFAEVRGELYEVDGVLLWKATIFTHANGSREKLEGIELTLCMSDLGHGGSEML